MCRIDLYTLCFVPVIPRFHTEKARNFTREDTETRQDSIDVLDFRRICPDTKNKMRANCCSGLGVTSEDTKHIVGKVRKFH